MDVVLGVVRRFGLLIAVGVFALVGFVFRDYLSGNVNDLKVGDCFDIPAEVDTKDAVDDVQHHPCSGLHEAEVFFIGDVPSGSGAFPGVAAFDRYAESACVPAYRAYTGRDFDTDDEHDIGYFHPTEEGWKAGDHTVDCYLYRVDEKPFKGSLKASR